MITYNDFSYEDDSLYTMYFENEILNLTNSNRIDNLGLSFFREGIQHVCAYTDICTLNCTVYVSRIPSGKNEASYLIEVKNITATKRKKR